MLTFNVLSNPSNGTLNFGSDASFHFKSDPGFAGTVEFAFEASNGTDSDTATVTIDVYNTAPEAHDSFESVLHSQILNAFVSGDVVVNEGHWFAVSGTFTGAAPDGEFHGPAWYHQYLVVDDAAGTWLMDFIALDDEGPGPSNTFTLTITVDDGEGTASDSMVQGLGLVKASDRGQSVARSA